jgi:excisionase family DNA binding protein
MSSTRDIAVSQRQQAWLSLKQAATIYGVSVDTLRRRITAGKLPALRFGPRLIRVRACDVEALFRPIPTIGTIHGRWSA